MKSFFVAATLLALAPWAAGSVVVFSDTFDYGGSPTFQPDLTDNAAARQAGGNTASTYSPQFVGPGANAAGLNVSNSQDVLLLRTFNPSSGASQAAVDLGTNFASDLAGKSYTISLTDMYFARGASDITDVWFSISVGDSATSISGPNATSADIAMLFRPRTTSNFTQWQDGSNAGSGVTGLNADFGFANRFQTVELRVDEIAGTAQGYFEDINGDTFTTSTWAVDFENDGHRYIELRAHQSATGTDNALMDARIDGLTITVIPEPSASLLLGGVFGLCLLVRRRA